MGPQVYTIVVNIHPHRQTEQGGFYTQLHTQTGTLMVVYDVYRHKQADIYTHTPPAFDFISCQSFELPFHHCAHRRC